MRSEQHNHVDATNDPAGRSAPGGGPRTPVTGRDPASGLGEVRRVNPSSDVYWHDAVVQRAHREAQNGHRGGVVWFTGLSGAGKSTLAMAVDERLHSLGIRSYVLDGDNLRHGLCTDLGFRPAERRENIRRAGEVAKLFVDAGIIVLAAFISPLRADRKAVRKTMPDGDFLEVYCNCPIKVCERRDPKGLYQRARMGGIRQFTGVSSRYEEPLAAELVLDMTCTVDSCIEEVMLLLDECKLLPNRCAVRDVIRPIERNVDTPLHIGVSEPPIPATG